MSNRRRSEWPGDRRRLPAAGRARQITTLDALLAGLEANGERPDLAATALVWLGLDTDVRSRDGSDLDRGHRAWLDRAEFWPEFRGALGTIARLDEEVGRDALPGAFAARPQSATPVPAMLVGDEDPWQQELAELIRGERTARLLRGAPGATRYLALYDAVAAGVIRMATAGIDPRGEAVVSRATLLAAHPHESAVIALDGVRLLGWRLRWAADPERERALLLAEAISRASGDVHEMLHELAASSVAWVAVPAES